MVKKKDRKILYEAIGGLIVLAALIYFVGLHTYFIRTEIQETLPSSMSSEPAVMRMGTFSRVDAIHKGSGTAKLFELDDQKILRLEDFNVVNGPDLYVYLTKTDMPTGDIKSLGDFIDLGPLKAPAGNQNYAVRDDVEGYKTAVVWCRRYGVLFTYAVMQ